MNPPDDFKQGKGKQELGFECAATTRKDPGDCFIDRVRWRSVEAPRENAEIRQSGGREQMLTLPEFWSGKRQQDRANHRKERERRRSERSVTPQQPGAPPRGTQHAGREKRHGNEFGGNPEGRGKG